MLYVIVNRMEGADEALLELGVKMHSILNILQITEELCLNKISLMQLS